MVDLVTCYEQLKHVWQSQKPNQVALAKRLALKLDEWLESEVESPQGLDRNAVQQLVDEVLDTTEPFGDEGEPA